MYPTLSINLTSLLKQSFLIASLLLFLLSCSSLTACNNQNLSPTKASLLVFGTFVEIVIYDENTETAEKAISQVEQTFHHMHKEWHAWEQGGIVSKINQAISAKKTMTVPESVKSFIKTSQDLTQQSQGLFDPGIGNLIALWGFHAEEWQGPPPNKEQIEHWLKSRPSILDIS